MIKILIVEDEEPIQNLIRLALTKAGYQCTCAADGMRAADLLDEQVFDLILLDVMLPQVDGFELMEYIRPQGIPVIFITAKNSISDRVRGLRMGAEDYIVKPFEVLELLARVEVVLRRYKKTDAILEIGALHIDTVSHRIQRGNTEIVLTPKEYELLLLFARNPNTALYRETIYERVWGGEYIYGSKTVDLHVQRLRRKVGWEEHLRAVSKVGYRLEIWFTHRFSKYNQTGGKQVKFRIKIALCMTCLVSVLFGAGASVLLSISFDNSLQLEKENAYNAYKMVLGTLKLVNAVKESPNYNDITYTLNSLADGSGEAWDALRLRTQEETLYTHGKAPFEDYTQDMLSGNLITAYIKGEDSRRWLQFSTSFSAGPSIMFLDAAYEITMLYDTAHAQYGIYHRIFLALIATAALLSYTIAYFLSAPLGRLSRAARSIASGDFAYRPHIRSSDEVGTLAADFNRMAQALEENIGEMEAAIERQESFMASFAHELKTPMTSIIGYADFIRSQTLTPEELSDAANYIFSEGKRLESLSLKLLDLLVLKKEKPLFQLVSPALVTRNLVTHLEPVYRAEGIRLQCCCEEGTCLLEPDLYKSLLVNLIDNARKALSDAQSGNIYVLVRMLPDGCRIQVADNGRGIPPEALAHLTQAFYRVDKSRSRRAGGVGLGLTLCSEIAQAHNGRISFESRMENGTCVTVELRGGKA